METTTMSTKRRQRPPYPWFFMVAGLGTFLWATTTIHFVVLHNNNNDSSVSSSSSTWIRTILLDQNPSDSTQIGRHGHNDDNDGKRLPPYNRIAIVSSFVSRNSTSARIEDKYLEQHLVNKACYADLWGYDYIFNTTWGYSDDIIVNNNNNNKNNNNAGTDKMEGSGHRRFWLDYGHWHRVPALQAALDERIPSSSKDKSNNDNENVLVRKYDWILYADMDYVIQDLRLPLQSFFREWELAGHTHTVHVLVPNDGDHRYSFSSFAVLIRNSAFGRRVVHHWNRAAHGLCSRGNFPPMDRYHWELSDQPGLWYALMQTHADFQARTKQNTTSAPVVSCNETSGYLATHTTLYDEMNAYFRQAGLVTGTHGADLQAVPRNQPILFSRYDAQGRSGLGVQRNWAFDEWKGQVFPHAFGMHTKYRFKREMHRDWEYCVKQRGCFARYKEDGKLIIGCNGTANMVH